MSLDTVFWINATIGVVVKDNLVIIYNDGETIKIPLDILKIVAKRISNA